ncbi:hypothetical protein Mapa_009942 [Marchantia paleacea]|nr:hypothetical protein Mapa_009942 [Marchantia paleacea]
MAFPPVTSSRTPRVVIVGAGMAGIAAAQRLQSLASSRLQLTVLEASERIGGRIRSSEFNGEHMELGATWIHGIEGSPIFKLATRIGAMDGGQQPWEGQDGFLQDELVRTEGGSEVDENIVRPVVDLFDDLLEQVKDVDNCRADAHQSIGTFLRDGLDQFLVDQRQAALAAGRRPWNDNDESLRQARGVFRSKEYLERVVTGADCLTELDVGGYQEYKEFPGDHRTIGKGYSTVMRELSSVLPDQTLQFCKKVEKIQWNQTTSAFPVSVHCQDGSIEYADHVLITVSLGVLKRATLAPSRMNKDTIDVPPGVEKRKKEDAGADVVIGGGLFNPALPVWKLDSIARLGYGVVNKVFIHMEPADGGQHKPLHMVFSSSDENDDEDRDEHLRGGGGPAWLGKTFSIYPINKKSHVLVTWFAGREALLSEAHTEEELMKGITDTLAKFGFPRGSCKGLVRSKWGTDPLFRGSYSYVKNGSTCDDMQLLAEPLPTSSDDDLFAPAAVGAGIVTPPLQLLFAGEATERHYYSTVHGAYLSGLREADRLLQHYDVI